MTDSNQSGKDINQQNISAQVTNENQNIYHDDILVNFQRLFARAAHVSDPASEFENLRSLLMNFAFTPIIQEKSADLKQASSKFIHRDDSVLRNLASKELEELEAKHHKRTQSDQSNEGDDIFIDDLNIYDNPETELTAAENVVQNFFQPLELLESTRQAEILTSEEIQHTQSRTTEIDKTKPSRLSQTAFDLFTNDGKISQTQTISGIGYRKIHWLALRFLELSNLKNRDQMYEEIMLELAGNQLKNCISFIIDSCTRENLEPAYLMLYKQQELEVLQKLLYGLQKHSKEISQKTIPNHRIAKTDFAVCSKCGTRQMPQVSDDIDDCDDGPITFPHECTECNAQTRERPCSIQVGRAVWDIVELSFRFERLVKRVDSILSKFSAFPQVHTHVEKLKHSMKNRYEVEFLDNYTKFLRDIEDAKLGNICSRASVSQMERGNLWIAYDNWSMNGHSYASNVSLRKCHYTWLVHSETPLEWAQKYISESIPQPSKVLSVLRTFAVQEIAIQPSLLCLVMERLLSCGISEFRHKGESTRMSIPAILENPFGVLTLLHDSTVELYIDMPNEQWQEMLKFDEYFCSSANDPVTEMWNTMYSKMQSTLINEILRNIVPVMKIVLFERAEWETTKAYLDRLEDTISVKGYSRCALSNEIDESLSVTYHDDTWKESLTSFETLELDTDMNRIRTPRVLAVYAPSEYEPINFAQLSETGSVVRMWQWSSMHIRSDAGKETYMKNLEQLKNFSLTFRPHVVAVGMTVAAHRRKWHTGSQKKSLFNTLKEFFDHPMIEVIWTDIRLPNTFGISTAAKEEFPMLSKSERICVSVGRVMRDPLSEVLRLCNHHNDILRLRLVEEQQCLNQARHRMRIDQLLSLWVSACGVNIHTVSGLNEAVNIFQYISGMDSEKADELKNIFTEKTNEIKSRQSCAKILPFSESIIQNCIGLLKITPDKAAEGNPFRALDATMVHPSYYRMIDTSAKVEEVLAQMSYDLKCYEQIPCRGRTLNFVTNEINHSGSSSFVRRSFRKITKPEIFESLSNVRFIQIPRGVDAFANMRCQVQGTLGTKLTVHVGDTVACRVISLTVRGMTVFTSKLIKGFIPVSKIGSKNANDVRDNWMHLLQIRPPMIKSGDHIDAQIVGVHYDNLQLILSWTLEDMNKPSKQIPRDIGFDHSQSNYRQDSQTVLSFQASRHVWFRSDITSGRAAIENLKNAHRGEVLLRYFGKNIFGIDFKLSDFHVIHIRVAEENINGEIRYVVPGHAGENIVFEDLDHCYIEYISPMITRFKDLESHPRAFCGSLMGLKKILKIEATETNKTSWRVFCSRKNPLYIAFVICNPKVLGEDPQCWPFSITHDGWRFPSDGNDDIAASLNELFEKCRNRLKMAKF